MSASSTDSATEEVRQRRGDAIRAAYQDPDVKERHRAAVVEAQNRPDLMGRRCSYRASDETKAKISASSAGRVYTVESVERQRRLYLLRSSACRFCGSSIEFKRTCINGRGSCAACFAPHEAGLASFRRPDGAFL